MNKTEPRLTHRQVLVVGARPVRLSAALALRSRGYPATILEAEPEARTRAGSRAIFVHRASLQLLEQMCLGLGRDIAAYGQSRQTNGQPALSAPSRATISSGLRVSIIAIG